MNIIILGMHRSGTSMITGILERLGYHIGHDNELMPQHKENPKGFFERKDFMDVNDKLLRDNNYEWYKIANFSIDSLSNTSKIEYKASIKKIIEKLDIEDKWAAKDPRFCLLYPLIKELIEPAIKLIVFRDPIETAESLWERNKFPLHYGLALWEAYYTQLLGSSALDKNILITNYNKLLTEPEAEIKILLDAINQISKTNIINDDINYALSFIDNKLHRSKKELKIGGNALTPNQFEIYNILRSFENNQSIKFTAKEINNKVLQQGQTVSGHINELQNSAKTSRKELNKIKNSLSWDLMKIFRHLALKNPKTAVFIDNVIRGSVKKIKKISFILAAKLGWICWCKSPADLDENISIYKNNFKEGKNKIAVYTAIFGGYDFLTVPDILSSDIDYICFTDRPINSLGVWQIHASPYYHPESRRIARYIKTHPHELLSNYEIVIWIDSNIVIRGDVLKYVSKLTGTQNDIGFIKHPLRSCVYEEAKACKYLKKEQFAKINSQIARYKDLQYPEQAGMFETNFFIANHNNVNCMDFFKAWWNEIDQYSNRDQLSVGWALYQSKVKVSHLMIDNISIRNNSDFSYYNHEISRQFFVPKELQKHSIITEPSTENRFISVKENLLDIVSSKSIDIVICVYNALNDVKLCLSSVSENLLHNEHIIIVNDMSDDETSDYLKEFCKSNLRVSLLENSKNMGYIGSANKGLKKSTADFRILLNSDTIVSKNWARKMADVAYSSEVIGIVGPLSNAAGSQSIPNIKGKRGQTAINILPKNLKAIALDKKCELWSPESIFPRVPLIHGFCFGIKKSVIESIGVFDDVNFERYYGEENDYCFRASKAGFEFAIATNTFVYHRKSRSIDDEERIIYMEASGKRLRELYGAESVSLACMQLVKHPLLQHMRKKAAKYFIARNTTVEPFK